MMDVVDASIQPRDSRNQSLATDLVPGAVPRDDDEEEPTPVKRLDAAFEVVTKQNPLDDAPALQVALRVRPLLPGLAEKSCMQIISDRKVHTTTPPSSGETSEERRNGGSKREESIGNIHDEEKASRLSLIDLLTLFNPLLSRPQFISRSQGVKSRSSPSTRFSGRRAVRRHSTSRRLSLWWMHCGWGKAGCCLHTVSQMQVGYTPLPLSLPPSLPRCMSKASLCSLRIRVHSMH